MFVAQWYLKIINVDTMGFRDTFLSILSYLYTHT